MRYNININFGSTYYRIEVDPYLIYSINRSINSDHYQSNHKNSILDSFNYIRDRLNLGQDLIH
jgi:hypothetical protein